MTTIEKADVPALPTLSALLLLTPLYRSIEIDEDRDAAFMERLQFGEVQYDAHCVECRKSSIFKTMRDDKAPSIVSSNPVPWKRSEVIKKRIASLVFEGKFFAVHATCQRHDHLQTFIFTIDRTGGYQDKPRQVFLKKIGQWPSFEDMAGPEGEKFKALLGSYYSEFKKAGGLISHGMAIAAFLYLRRVFESLVERHRVSFEASTGSISGYSQMDMKGRIKALKSTLPSRVVENASVWSILSKGVHELSEEECAAYFPPVRAAIIAMLEEDFERQEKAKADEALRLELAKISSTLGGAGSTS